MTNKMPIVAAAITAFVAVPFGATFVGAVADGEHRWDDTIVRAMLSDDSVDALRAGRTPEQHYLGNDRIAPDFTLNDQHGRPFHLAASRGHTVVLNFWSVTCPPCVEELPSLERLGRILRFRRDIELVTISVDRNYDAVKHLFTDGHAGVRILFDPERRVVGEKYGTRLFPETWVIDRHGVIRARVDGPRDWSAPLALELFGLY